MAVAEPAQARQSMWEKAGDRQTKTVATEIVEMQVLDALRGDLYAARMVKGEVARPKGANMPWKQWCGAMAPHGLPAGGC